MGNIIRLYGHCDVIVWMVVYGAAQTGSPILFITVMEAINKGLLNTLPSEFLRSFIVLSVTHSN